MQSRVQCEDRNVRAPRHYSGTIAVTIVALLAVASFIDGCTDGDKSDSRGTGKDDSVIVIGLNPSERAENIQQNAERLAAAITRGSGLKVRIFVAHDYSGLVEALRGGTVDFAFFAPVSYIFAEKIADAEVLLKAERKGKPFYYGCIIVNAEGNYHRLEDLRGHEIAWVDPTSASGHIFPKGALLERGIDPEKFFSRQTFAGGHDAVILSVVNGTVDAGGTYCNDTLGNDGSWSQLGDGAFAGKVRPIFFSNPIPGDNLATTHRMIRERPDVVERLRRAVMGITRDSSGRALMQAMYHVDAMVPATSSDYEPVRKAAELLHLDITGSVGAANADTTTAAGRNRRAGLEKNSEISTVVAITAGLLAVLALVLQTAGERRRRRKAPRVATPTSGSTPPTATSVESNTTGTTAATAVNAATGAPQFHLQDISVVYTASDGTTFTALDGVNLAINRGEFVAVIGLSGAGKSTLLRTINLTVRPSTGRVVHNGIDVTDAHGAALVGVRGRIGFIFQGFNLVRNMSVLKNVLTGRLAHVGWWASMSGAFPKRDREIALAALGEVGLAAKVRNRASNLSGGEQQRVAIARALAQAPEAILADEPMASLDPKLSEVVLGLLRTINQKSRITVVVNLHVLDLARRYADRIVALRHGRIVFDGDPNGLSESVLEAIYGDAAAPDATEEAPR